MALSREQSRAATTLDYRPPSAPDTIDRTGSPRVWIALVVGMVLVTVLIFVGLYIAAGRR